MSERKTAEDIAKQLGGKKRGKNTFIAKCPCHEDTNPSCVITETKNGWVSVRCHKCDENDIRRKVGLPIWGEYTNGATNGSGNNKPFEKKPLTIDAFLELKRKKDPGFHRVVDYLYQWPEDPEPLFANIRFKTGAGEKAPRWFSRKENGEWFLGLDDVPDEKKVLLYRFKELQAAPLEETVFILEGEKDVETLRKHGLTATCNPFGAGEGKWKKQFAEHFQGRHVAVCGDNDISGRKHRHHVVASVIRTAETLKIIDLPGVKEKGDVTDWLEMGNTIDDFLALVHQAPLVQKPSLEIPDDAQQTIALEFARRYRATLRFCHSSGKWHRWTGAHWQADETQFGFWYACELCRQIAKGLGGAHERAYYVLNKRETAAAVEALARTNNDPVEPLSVTAAYWDKDPWLLGTPIGTIDLRTGEADIAKPEYGITKLTSVPPRAGEPTLWLKFLDEVTREDKELQRFLQQICGYCLTGDTRERSIFFCYGPGGNGKSVFLNVLSGVLGAHAKTAGMETFVASKHDRHPTELAVLKGARLVTASETEEGRAWAESKIKQITGDGDVIRARFMRRDSFEFTPEFKLFIVGNHKPVLKNVDQAARDRFKLIPFLFRPPEPDRQLEKKLRAEFPLILQWMIAGCLDWQQNGLVIPPVVLEATNEYFEAQDTFTQWFEERCEKCHDELFTASNLLFNDWKHFAEQLAIPPGNANKFAERMQARGFKKARQRGKNQARGFFGVRLIDKPEEKDESMDGIRF